MKCWLPACDVIQCLHVHGVPIKMKHLKPKFEIWKSLVERHMKHLRRIKGILFNEYNQMWIILINIWYNFDERHLSIIWKKKILLIIICILVPSLNFEIYICPLLHCTMIVHCQHTTGWSLKLLYRKMAASITTRSADQFFIMPMKSSKEKKMICWPSFVWWQPFEETVSHNWS